MSFPADAVDLSGVGEAASGDIASQRAVGRNPDVRKGFGCDAKTAETGVQARSLVGGGAELQFDEEATGRTSRGE